MNAGDADARCHMKRVSVHPSKLCAYQVIQGATHCRQAIERDGSSVHGAATFSIVVECGAA